MLKNQIKTIKIILTAFISFFAFSSIACYSLGWTGNTSGNGEKMAGCGSRANACYSGAGLRFTLYQYNTTTNKATKLGKSYDIWKDASDFPNPRDGMKIYKVTKVGETTEQTVTVKYSDPTKSTDAINLKHKYNKNITELKKQGIDESIFTLNNFQYKNKKQYSVVSFTDYISDAPTFIKTYLTDKGNKNLINKYFGSVEKIKKNLNVTISGNVSNYYLVVETLYQMTYKGPSLVGVDSYSLWKSDNDWTSPGIYVGTAFELAHIYDYFPKQYNTTLTTTGNVGKFVNSKDGFLIPATSSYSVNDVMKKGMYGMAAYKLSDYIDPSCDCSTASNKYSCAKTYCDANATEANRKTCVTNTCSVKDPGFASCSDDSSTEGTTTSCAASTSSSKKTCTKANSNNYYKTTCTETSHAYYNDSLPTSLAPGMGFSYSLLLSGTKTCNTSFDVNKWNFDYAVATNSGRDTLKTKLNDYKNLSKDDLEGFKYNSSDANVTIDIEENVEKKEKTTTTKKLSHFAKVNETDITVSNSTNEFKTMTEKSKSKNKTFTSSMSSIYNLPDVCVDGATGDIYDATYNSRDRKYECKATSNGPYTKFFTNLKASSTVNNTTVKITKSSSSMDDLTNKCYYQVEDRPLSCVIEKDKNIYSLKIYSEYDIDYTKLRYVLSTNPNDENWSSIATSDNTLGSINAADVNNDGKVDDLDSILLQEYLAGLDKSISDGKGDINSDGLVDIFDTTELKRYLDEKMSQSYNIQLDGSNLSQNLTIYGKIKYEGKDNATTICSINQISKNEGDRCTVTYKPTQYAEISNYCRTNWYKDKDNYASEKACYDACTGLKSCKLQYSCSDTKGKEEFCKEQYNPVTEVNSYRACINDCACNEGEAVYRPISLSNPFPNNRKAGSNWQGYEKNINDGSENDKAEYVIELTAQDIENINEQTKLYNNKTRDAYTDYVWAGETNGKYVSKFIHETNSSLFCVVNGEGTCD